jgi:hypothetical protein
MILTTPNSSSKSMKRLFMSRLNLVLSKVTRARIIIMYIQKLIGGSSRTSMNLYILPLWLSWTNSLEIYLFRKDNILRFVSLSWKAF